MGMPQELVLVRHGESAGNVANNLAKEGDISHFTDEFRETPGHQWELTPQGIEQAAATGNWILNEIAGPFDRYYVSPHKRTRQTAARLDIPNARWRIDDRLRERDWGDIDATPRGEYIERYPHNAQRKDIDSLYWRPPGGESIAEVKLRFRDFLGTLHRECEDQRVLVVTHGEFMWAARAVLEYMTTEEWVAADEDKSQKIHNTQVLHYSKVNPEDPQAKDKYLSWYRSICPWRDENDFSWHAIKRTLYSNQDLLEDD